MGIKYTTLNKKPKAKKTRQGAGRNSKGHKKYRGQGGPKKRVRQTNKPR